MDYTIQQLAQLSGVTRRTLRHYDQIDLLKPQRSASSGYRMYGTQQVNRLQQILFYRAMGFSLAQIRKTLDDPAFDMARALEENLSRLHLEKQRLTALIENAEKTLQALKGEDTMTDKEKFNGLKQSLIAENEAQYGEEIRQKYGNDTINASNAKLLNLSPAHFAQFEQVGQQLNNALREAVKNGDPKSSDAKALAALHKQWLSFSWPSYSPEAHRGLMEMYLADERFRSHYEEIAPGGAQFLHDAVCHWLDTGGN